MEMTRLEKRLVNRESKARFNIELLRQRLGDLVISQHMFHHIAAWQQVVREITRVLRDGGYMIWLDLALPALVKKILQPLGKRYGLYTFGEVKTEMQRSGLNQVFYEKLVHWLFVHHHLVLQKG